MYLSLYRYVEREWVEVALVVGNDEESLFLGINDMRSDGCRFH